MRLRISDNTMELILLVLIVVMAASAYRFGYMKFAKQAEEIEAKNRMIEKENQNLEARIENKPKLEAGIEKAAGLRRDILKAYSGGTTIEKYLVILTEFEDIPKIGIGSASYTPDTDWFSSTQLDENGNPRVKINRSQFSISYTAGYEQLKEFIDYLHNNKEKITVESLNATENDEYGLLSGNITLSFYTVQDEDHQYEAPVIEGLPIGKDNIFNEQQRNDSDRTDN